MDQPSQNRRTTPRVKRRLKVDFGEQDFTASGLTGDISPNGMFLITNHLLAAGTRIHLRIHVEHGVVYAEGLVRRQKLVPRELRTTEPQGLGVRFLTPQEVLSAVPSIGGAAVGNKALELTCASLAAVRQVLEEQLPHGHVTVPAGTRQLAVPSEQQLAIRMPFLGPEVITLVRTRVVQLLQVSNEDGRQSHLAVLQVSNPDELRTRLLQLCPQAKAA